MLDLSRLHAAWFLGVMVISGFSTFAWDDLDISQSRDDDDDDDNDDEDEDEDDDDEEDADGDARAGKKKLNSSKKARLRQEKEREIRRKEAALLDAASNMDDEGAMDSWVEVSGEFWNGSCISSRV